MKNNVVSSIPNHIGGLDELRGIAALAVLVVHANFLFPDLVRSNAGPIAVDLFLLISGFLIGKILLKTKGNPLFFRRFYVRRIFRIAPLSWMAIGGGVLLSIVLNRSLLSAPYYLFFVQNFIPVDLVHEAGSAAWIGPLPGCSPLWSLAVEEHFYLLLPLIIRSFGVKKLPCILLSVAIVCIFLKVMGTYAGGGWYTNPHQTWMRIPYLLLGVMLNFDNRKVLLGAFFLIWAGILAWFHFPQVTAELPICLILLGLVYGAVSGRVVLKNKFLAFSGKFCFGLYVIHYFIRAFFDNVGFDYSVLPLKWGVFFLYLIISYFLAVVSFYCFEMPVQRFRTRFEGGVVVSS